MRAKIMLLHFALLLVVVASASDPIAFSSPKEMGSRSMLLLGNASDSAERDFRLFEPDDSLRKEKPTSGRKIDKLNGSPMSSINQSDDDFWIKSEIDETDDFLKMHAFVVKDEDIPECDTPADKVTFFWRPSGQIRAGSFKFIKRRYFMCSGVILNGNHVLTSATCVNQARIHEYHIEADLAVLIGALGVENSYIIKIAHYEIHPRYVPDPNSIRYATNNIALLRLSCSIPRKYVVVPKLPSKRFEDIAHLCCSDRCKLSVVIEESENQHIIRLIKLKHLPSPVHIDVEILNVNNINKNVIKSNLPGIGKTGPEDTNKQVPLESLGGRYIRQAVYDVKTPNLTDSSNTSKTRNAKTSINDNETKNKKSIRSSLQEDDEVIDWNEVKMEVHAAKVSQKNQKLLFDIVQNSLSDVMTKLLEVMTHHIADTNNLYNHFENILRENALPGKKSYQTISDLVGKSILKLVLEKMSIIENNYAQNYSKYVTSDNSNVENQVDDKKSESNETKINEIREDSEKPKDILNKDKTAVDTVHCPPLGSPVIVNKTLVALIAYTCDDVQNWVEWKYVNIIHNIRWIRKELKRKLTKDELI